MAIEIDEPTFFETFLHYGLLLGAAFQLVCIFAVIFIPKSENEQDVVSDESRQPSNIGQSQQSQTHSKKSKKEKKKHR